MSSTQQHREVGTSFETEKRTITDTDIINFAGLSGDFNALHVNDQFLCRSVICEQSGQNYSKK